MDHTHIIRTSDLDHYSDKLESRSVIPELIYHLVKQSARNLSVCRIPYGDNINQPGWDGLVETDEAFREFIPAGKSYWEIGTSSKPESKATSDFKKRTNTLSDNERAEATFVFLTPRSSESGGWSEPKQTKWIAARKDSGWRQIRIIDGVKLADWLREFPAIGRWMANKMGLTRGLGGLTTPAEHWENLLAGSHSRSARNDPPLPPRLFIEGRDNACQALQKIFEGKIRTLRMFAESPNDVADFVSAYLETLESETARDYSNRCLYIDDEDAWRSVAETRSAHVFVASTRLALETDERSDLLAIAHRKDHSIVIPLSGAWSGNNPEILKLRSPSQSQIEDVLKENGYSRIRARELASIGGDRLSALRRHLLGLGDVPPYATWDNASLIAQAGLAGKWYGNSPADRAALEMLLGKGYGEWIETLRPDVLRSDSSLIQIDEKWRFVARGEAWNALGSRITDDDLDRLQKTAVTVLGERDPQFDMPKEERYAARATGKNLEYSALLRQGLAETLALVGSRGQALSSCSLGKANSTAVLVVRGLLSNADWVRWASLNSHLPMLAEAAPDEFLDAVESALVDLETTPFNEIFSQEGGGVLGGSNYMTGLLWALETLAWNPDHLSRVSMILADIASIDPGGNWANRPANSLTDIFLPWHVQTTAPFDKRKSAIESMLKEQPEVAWRLLLSLLPHSYGTTSGCRQPIWREYIPHDWKDEGLVSEYWEQISVFAELAIMLAKESAHKLGELIDRLADLPDSAQNTILAYLSSKEAVALPEAERLPLWEQLKDLVRKNTYSCAFPKKTVDKIEKLACGLIPESPYLKYRYLFSREDFSLLTGEGSYSEQQKQLDDIRQEALQEILNSRDSFSSALAFARNVSAPFDVGRSLGAIASENIENEILPSYLIGKDETVKQVVDGFVHERYRNRKWRWANTVIGKRWTKKEKAAFLVILPFDEKIWKKVVENLGEDEAHYWRNVAFSPYGLGQKVSIAVKKLIQYGRPAAAVNCVARITDKDNQFDQDLAVQAILALLDNPSDIQQLDSYQTVELIKRLQELPDVDQGALFRIEWNLLPWLDRFSSGSPATLEKRLATNPAFFVEIVGLVFRSTHDDTENAEPDKQKQDLAGNAFRLLSEWKRCPGIQDDGSFDADAFNTWIDETRQKTEESGHVRVAQLQIGQVLINAPPDPNGLWIHESVASVLNSRETQEMLRGFTIALYNQRGVHNFTHGREERELAKANRIKAEDLNDKGYTRFATAMRKFAEQYNREAEHAEKRDPYDGL